MKPFTKSILSGMVLTLCASVVGVQAWLVADVWLKRFNGTSDLIAPFWYVERSLITAFAFYSSVAFILVLHRQRTWILFTLCLIAFGLCLSGLVNRTLWGLPTFVGVHLVALLYVVVRCIRSLLNPSRASAISPRLSDAHETVLQKVEALFRELAGERAARLGEPGAQSTREVLASALSADHAPDTAREIAFHLVDWHSDAAFIMAMHLFPERFTPEELSAGTDMVLIHAPNHLAAAAKLAGHPIQDVFEVGVLEGADPDV